MGKTIVTDIIEALKEQIESGTYRPGEKLPAERTLAAQFGVSRNSMREALHYFENLGIIRTVTGSGSYIAEQKDTLTDVFNLRQLIEKYDISELLNARIVIETGTVAMAASRATRADKLKLKKYHQRMKDISADKAAGNDTDKNLEAYIQYDFGFHMTIAEISGNSILQDILRMLYSLMETTTRLLRVNDRSPSPSDQEHEDILNAISANDPEWAVRAMRTQLENVREMISSSGVKNDGPESPVTTQAP